MTTVPSRADKHRRPSFARVAGRAAASPLNLSVAGAAAVGAAVLQAWPLAALGGAAYVALVAWDLASPEFWKKALGAPPRPEARGPDLPDPGAVEDPALRDSARAIASARADLDRIMADARGDVAVQLAGVTVSIDELEGRAVRLVRSGRDLARYLGQTDRSEVRSEMERMRARADTATDASAREQYLQTIAARAEQLKALDDLAAALERVHANLARIEATLEGLAAKVVRMAAMDAQAMDDLSGDVNSELERLNMDIKTFEETLGNLVKPEVART